MKVLALDYGSARTGVAVSDPSGLIARPLTVVEQVRTKPGTARLLALIAEEQPEVCKLLSKRMKEWVKGRVEQTGKPDPILGYKLGLGKAIGSIATAKNLQAR